VKKVIITTKWIPVTERLPELLEPVLTYRPEREYNGRHFAEHYEVEDVVCDEFVLNSVYGEATHWMPLPKPPKA